MILINRSGATPIILGTHPAYGNLNFAYIGSGNIDKYRIMDNRFVVERIKKICLKILIRQPRMHYMGDFGWFMGNQVSIGRN
jgi:hypothetical protein